MHSFGLKHLSWQSRPHRGLTAALTALLLLGACGEQAAAEHDEVESPSTLDPTAPSPDSSPSVPDSPATEEPTPTPTEPTPEEPTPVPTVPAPTAPTPEEPTPAPTAPTAGEPVLQSLRFTAATDDFLNPERGFYGHVNLLGSGDFSGIRSKGQTLAYAAVNLGAYRGSALPDSVLAGLDAGFERVRRAGIKVILRFVYTESMGGQDAPLSRVEQHLKQLTPVLGRNADVIVVLQAGLIGAWGEWHASSSGLDTPSGRAAVMRALLAALPASRMVQIRTPQFKQESFGGPLTEAQAFSGSGAARVGHHNDCFLASATDMGTYPSNNVEQWKSFVAQEGRFTPVGGETCAVSSPRSDCASATAELSRLHWTYVNSAYNTDVLGRWTSQGCMPDIRRKLGYRFELLSASLNSTVRAGQALTLELALRNTGYAAPFNARPVYLVLEGPGGRHALQLEGADPRRWEFGKTLTLRHQVQVPQGLAAGTYRVSLWLPDAASTLRDRPEYAIRLANQGTWVADRGLNLLTANLQVQ